jgi:hypothetical protein
VYSKVTARDSSYFLISRQHHPLPLLLSSFKIVTNSLTSTVFKIFFFGSTGFSTQGLMLAKHLPHSTSPSTVF